ncbi:unnamed protein product [Mytilus coruscus]|uniref:Uncharacterized protein n=1 Tax=Mytilus coruscus TaxID=42192 RepID=A0A6J8CPS9_MYTCO|nr:unnamed protein product [Mytilus coruscus]
MASAEFKELKILIMGVDKKVSDFSQQLEKVEHEVKTDVNVLKTKYDESQLEITSLRQDFTELEQGVAVTRQLFSQNLNIEQRKANAIPIANAHRVPTRGSGPKPIIVRFIHYGDKQLIMSSAHNLKGSQIRILDDLPVSMKEERFLLSHVAYTIRKKRKIANTYSRCWGTYDT